MPVYDYRCPGGHITELLRPSQVNVDRCSKCGAPAQRVPFNRTYISRIESEGFSGADIGRALENKKNIRDTTEFRQAEGERAEILHEIHQTLPTR